MLNQSTAIAVLEIARNKFPWLNIRACSHLVFFSFQQASVPKFSSYLFYYTAETMTKTQKKKLTKLKWNFNNTYPYSAVELFLLPLFSFFLTIITCIKNIYLKMDEFIFRKLNFVDILQLRFDICSKLGVNKQ